MMRHIHNNNEDIFIIECEKHIEPEEALLQCKDQLIQILKDYRLYQFRMKLFTGINNKYRSFYSATQYIINNPSDHYYKACLEMLDNIDCIESDGTSICHDLFSISLFIF